ncbi:MAG: hypothetical protein ACREOS_10190, partial [Candidatus Dormibacteraceae bacterium]
MRRNVSPAAAAIRMLATQVALEEAGLLSAQTMQSAIIGCLVTGEQVLKFLEVSFPGGGERSAALRDGAASAARRRLDQ